MAPDPLTHDMHWDNMGSRCMPAWSGPTNGPSIWIHFFFCILLPSFLSFSILFIFQDPTTTPFLNQSSVYWALTICPISHHGKHHVYMVRCSSYPDPMSWALYPDTEIWWLMPCTIFPMKEWFPSVHILLCIHTFHIFHSLRFNPVIYKTVLTESCI